MDLSFSFNRNVLGKFFKFCFVTDYFFDRVIIFKLDWSKTTPSPLSGRKITILLSFFNFFKIPCFIIVDLEGLQLWRYELSRCDDPDLSAGVSISFFLIFKKKTVHLFEQDKSNGVFPKSVNVYLPNVDEKDMYGIRKNSERMQYINEFEKEMTLTRRLKPRISN